MNILIAGASGFIGHELVKTLKKEYTISILGRNKTALIQDFPDHDCYTWESLETLDANHFDVIINLCGFNISKNRWTHRIKQEIIDSRTKTTNELTKWMMSCHAKPRFFCANAVGIYGAKEGDTPIVTEDTLIDSLHPHDFLSEVGIRWQEALSNATHAKIPVVSMRFGVVLKKKQGMLKKLFPSFYFGLGSVIGDGKQYISWIHVDDVVGGIRFLIKNPELNGDFNFTSPNPVTQKDFAKIFAKTLNRPLFFQMPKRVIQLLFGEMGEYLLLRGQRVVPKRLSEAGYHFKYPELYQALEHEFM